MSIRLLRRPEVEALTGLSRAAIYAQMRAGTFPLPRRLGPQSVAWLEREVEEWIESLPTATELCGDSQAPAGGDR